MHDVYGGVRALAAARACVAARADMPALQPLFGGQECYLARLDFHQARGLGVVYIDADGAREQVSVVKGRYRRAQAVLPQDVEPRQRVRGRLRPFLRNFLYAVRHHFAAGDLHGVGGGYDEQVGEPIRMRLVALHAPVFGYDTQRGAERRQVHINRRQPVGSQGLDVFPNRLGYQNLDVFPRIGVAGKGFGLHRAADQQDGGARGGLVADVQAALRLGFDGPSAGYGKAGLYERHSERVPRGGGFVGEHHGHDAVRLDDAAAFAENLAHLGVVVVCG